MKKIILLLLAATIIFTACGSKSPKTDANSKEITSATKPEQKANDDMETFISKFDGKGTTVEALLKQYGKEGLVTADMELYDLENPEIVETNGNCYVLQAKSGITKRKYTICWKSGKISSVEDKGME